MFQCLMVKASRSSINRRHVQKGINQESLRNDNPSIQTSTPSKLNQKEESKN